MNTDLSADLVRVREELERQVAERTSELARANEELKREIAERERLHAESANSAEALRVSEASNRAVIDNMLTGLITTDERSVIEIFNPAAEKLFGYSASEIVGRHLSMLLPLGAAQEATGFLREARDKALGQVTEWPARRRNGEIFTMELALFEFQTPDRRRHYAGSVRDVSTAREVERLKGEFVSTVSHELRTPLTSIRGALGLVNGGAAGEIPDRARALLEIAYQNTERLSLLVNDILDLEKLDSGHMDLRVEPLHASIFLESLVEANQAYAIPYGVRLEFVPYAAEVWILADRDRLGQVVTNLVSNAIKFSPGGETVTVSLSRDAARGRVRMTVADRGPGIPDGFRAKIFQRFQQADSSDTRQKGGTGLGLAITKSIVERLGGEISFESIAGDGTSFHVDLPESTTAQPALVPPSKPVEARGPALRILVCEDDPDQANRLSLILQDAGCRTEVARDAARAKALLSERHFDAMTLDIVLPGQDGISLIQELRAGTETRALPIVVVSLDPERGRSQLSGDAFGILDWLGKPVDPERLLAAVGRAGQGARARPRILHVEDDPDILTLLATLVQNRADVVSVKTCGEGKRALAEEDFDLLVLDLELPDGRGLDLLPLLHRAGRRPTPVIVFSAHKLSRAMAFDIEAVLTKSQTSNEEILRTIESLVKLPRAGAA
jgi:PAS domain S-box-containing protein